MSSLISDDDKAAIQAVFTDIHDTFARDITVYKLGEAVFVDTDGSHNPLYSEESSLIQENELVPFTVKARVKYGSQQGREGLGANAQLGIQVPDGTIRLKVDETTYGLITEAKKIKVDDRLCELISAPARPGPFSPNFWTVFLKQID